MYQRLNIPNIGFHERGEPHRIRDVHAEARAIPNEDFSLYFATDYVAEHGELPRDCSKPFSLPSNGTPYWNDELTIDTIKGATIYHITPLND